MSFPRYEKYKESGVEWLGDVPQHWGIQPCRAVVSDVNERNEGAVCQDYLSLMANIGVIPYEEKGDVGNKKPEDLTKCKIVRRGDIVINSMNYGIGSYGMSSYNGVCSPVYIVLRVHDDVVLPRFALRIFENSLFQKYAAAFGNGILEHRAAINWDDLKGIGIGLPSKDEQLSILQFLDRETAKIDALVEEQRRLIELLKEKRQAVISHAVTKGLNPDTPMKDSGIEWLGQVPEHWSVTAVSYRYSVQLGKMLDSTKITGEHLRPYLRVFDVQWGEINTDDLPQMDFDEDARTKFRLITGDLLVNEGGSYPGRSAIWPSKIAECYYQKALHRVRPRCPETDTTLFLFYLMYWAANQGVFIAGGNETTIEHLPAEKLRRYRFAFPSMTEQLEIAALLDSEVMRFDVLTNEAQHAIDLLQERRAALVSAAVTGKIDVRGTVKEEAS
jgi:type I restriction enzyme, S subunit